MKNATTFRFVILALTMTLCFLAQNPRLADAAACPPVTCQALSDDCAQLSCAVLQFTHIGTCTEGGTNHNEFFLRCTCLAADCYE
jgi:hypothetical protein